MSTNDYLKEVLKQQSLADDSNELSALRERRAAVEKLLKDAFSNSTMSIRYGGSKAKNTMIRENYDLDMVCYFASDDTAAGASLEDIYKNTSKALAKDYFVTEKTSAIRLAGKDQVDFHVDVVPGRFVDGNDGDVYIYQKDADKCRLKTNLDIHISHIRDSGLTDVIRLMKLWSARNVIRVKTFILELMVIDLLADYKNESLSDQLVHVFTTLRDGVDDIQVEDPANPSGNDLTPALDSARSMLSMVASSTMIQIDAGNWEQVFGAVSTAKSSARSTLAAAAASTFTVAAKPWASTDE